MRVLALFTRCLSFLPRILRRPGCMIVMFGAAGFILIRGTVCTTSVSAEAQAIHFMAGVSCRRPMRLPAQQHHMRGLWAHGQGRVEPDHGRCRRLMSGKRTFFFRGRSNKQGSCATTLDCSMSGHSGTRRIVDRKGGAPGACAFSRLGSCFPLVPKS